jgi:hypothetical protein
MKLEEGNLKVSLLKALHQAVVVLLVVANHQSYLMIITKPNHLLNSLKLIKRRQFKEREIV